jgi:hypothetical protein
LIVMVIAFIVVIWDQLWCTLTPPHWLMIHPWSDPYFHRIGAWPACVGIL